MIVKRKPLVHATADDVIVEIKKKGDYINITESNAQQVAELLSTGIFSDYTFHAAMRLIERFVDFRYDDWEEQMTEFIEMLKKAVEDSFANGLEYVPYKFPYEDSDNISYYGMRMTIKPEQLSDDIRDEAVKVLGTMPIELTVVKDKTDQYNHCLINTIYYG